MQVDDWVGFDHCNSMTRPVYNTCTLPLTKKIQR